MAKIRVTPSKIIGGSLLLFTWGMNLYGGIAELFHTIAIAKLIEHLSHQLP